MLFRDWLIADADVRAEYLAVKRAAAADGPETTDDYAEAKEPWLVDAYRRAGEWADATDWRP